MRKTFSEELQDLIDEYIEGTDPDEIVGELEMAAFTIKEDNSD